MDDVYVISNTWRLTELNRALPHMEINRDVQHLHLQLWGDTPQLSARRYLHISPHRSMQRAGVI